MGRIGINPLKWEKRGFYLLNARFNLSGTSNYYYDTGTVVFGGLPLFKNGRIQYTSCVPLSAPTTCVFARVPTSAVPSLNNTPAGYRLSHSLTLSPYKHNGKLYRDSTTLGAVAFEHANINTDSIGCYMDFQGNQITWKFHTYISSVTDSTYTAGHIGLSITGGGQIYSPSIDFGGSNPVWPTDNIAYLRYRVLRNGNPVQGAEVVAVHHNITEMMIHPSGYPGPIIPKIGIARGVTGPDGWVEIPLDTDDGPWMISVRYPDGDLWYTAESKPGRMPVLYS